MDFIIDHPWINRKVIPVGGCRYIGFDKLTDLLLICSTAGRGVIDCANGKVIARDRAEYEPDALSRSLGIGPLENKIINVVSIYQLTKKLEDTLSNDRWSMIKDIRDSVFLVPPHSNSRDDVICIWSKKDSAAPLSSYVISHSEKYIAVASSSEIFILAKDDAIELNSLYCHHKNIHPKIKFVESPSRVS